MGLPKMADKDIVRITYKEAEEIAHLNEEKKAKQKREEERKKRPTINVYQPPSILRHKQNEQQHVQVSVLGSGNEFMKKQEETVLHIQEEDWDEDMLRSSSTSKESSVEKELEDINKKVEDLKVTGAETHTSDKVRRKKRPEIQRYVPKRRLLEQQNLGSNSDGSGDRNDDRSSLSPKRSISSSPTPVVSNAIQSPVNVSPRKIDLKNDLKDIQVTVINVKLGEVDYRESPEKVIEMLDDHTGYAKSMSQSQTGQARSRGRGKRLNQNVYNIRHNEPNVGKLACENRRNSTEKEIFNNSHIEMKADIKPVVISAGNISNLEKNINELKGDSDMYIVPSRPSTIGQEADRKDRVPVGMEESKSKIDENLSAVSDRQSILERFKKLPSKSKSRSYDKLNNTDIWEEVDYFPDPQNLGTLVFERSRSSEQLNLSGKDLGKPVPKSSSGLNDPKKVSGMRKRTDSLSSDISTATTGSDWSSDTDMDNNIESKKINWSEEVERELALQVQDETQKMNEWFQRQEMGLSQKESLKNNNNNAHNHVMTSSSPGFGSGGFESKAERIPEKFSTLPFARKKHNEDNRSRQQNRTRGIGSRDSSISSAQSIHSAHSAYSNDSCRRRRRRRKNSSGSQKALSGSMENLNMNIKVTCGGQGNKREVQVSQYGECVKGKMNRQGSYEQINRQMDRDNNWRGDGQCRGDDRWFDGRKYDRRVFKEEFIDSYQSKDSWPRDDKRPSRGRNWPDRGSRGGSSGNKRNEPNSRRDDGRMYEAKDHFDRNRGGFHDNQQRREMHDYRKPERGSREDNDKLSRSRDFKQDEHVPHEGDQEGSHPHGGGILHLPVQSKQEEVVLTQSPSQGQHQPYPRQPDHHGDWGQGPDTAQPQYSRERQHSGSNQRQKSLYDPNNPTKPILIGEAKPILVFKDTDAYSPPAQSSYLPPSSPYDMYSRGYGQMYPQSYGYNMPPMPLMPPSTLMYPGYGYPVAPQDYMYGRDPDYVSDFDQEHQTMASCSRSQCRIRAENLLQEALPLDKQLHCLMGRRFDDDTMHMINKLRQEVLVRLEQLILLDPDLSNRQNVEQILWKSVFHNIVELIRKQVADEPKEEETKVLLNKYLDEGTSFYEALLDKLQNTFCFKLEQYLDTSILPPENLSRNIKLALLSAQRTMICLGDIARYKEQNHGGSKINYGKARSWYTKAQRIAPKNGRPYHQLAILALYTKRKLDAVYYYMRSLAASNPFLTARESLLSLFDEARKKAEAAEKMRFEERKKRDALRKTRNMKQHRIEIWVKKDGTSSESKVDDNYDEDLSKLDASQLNKRFVLSFLNVHGKLFTKIGMEMFSDSCGQMLQEFKALFKYNAIAPQRLLQLMAINMFAIENTALKDESLGSTCRSLLQQHSVQMGLDMFGILVEKCANLLAAHMNSNDSQSHIFSREMEELVPCVKIWTDWMICHADLWNPPPLVRDPSIGPEIDMWSCTANLCNILKEITTSHVKFYTDRQNSLAPVILSEDMMMSGFVPLLSSPLNNTFVEKTVDKDIARDCLRVEKLRVFGEYLCGIDPPMLAYSVENKKYYSIAPSQGYGGDKHNENPDVAEEDDVVIEKVEEINHEEVGHLEHVQHLIAKKEELEKKMEEQKKIQETRNRVLETNRHRAIEIEIHPSFLIPDTNCFIDYFPSMKKLISEKQFTIVVPLVVVNELNGLAQGKHTGNFNSEDHTHKVKSYAEATIKFLEGEFEKKVTHLKALTSKGTVMETISYRSEETDNSGNNDDLILNCCTHYCKDNAQDYMPTDKDAPVRLYRDVVLLTDDRNLRLKAHVHNIPVKDVPAFMKWCSAT